MRVATAFKTMMLAVVVSSSLALLVAGSETAPSGAVTLMIVFLSAITGGLWPKKEKTRKRLWNILAVLALALFLTELALTGDILPSVVKLVVFLTAFKLFNLATNRDYFSLFMLTFLQLLAAASVSYDYRFAIPFALYIVTSCLTLMLYTIKAGSERESHTRGIISGSPLPALSPRLSWRWLPGALVVSLSVLILTAFLFPLLPRVRTNVLGPGGREPMQRIAGFSPVVDLGEIGLIKRSRNVIMRVSLTGEVSTQGPIKLRGIALNNFDGRRWSRTMGGARRITRSRDGLYRLPDAPIGPALEQEIYLNPLNTRILFAAGEPEALRGPFGDLYQDRMETLYYTRRNMGQIRYIVSSTMPDRLPDTLRGIQADPRGKLTRSYYIDMPETEWLTENDHERIEELALLITEDQPDLYAKMLSLESFLRSNFRYTLDLRPYQGDRSKLVSFLFDRREGHCEFYATAMAVMARKLGVASRVVNGFQMGEYNSIGGFYTVRGADAHSWVEVYFPGHGWVEFDPTPSEGQGAAAAEGDPFFLWGLLESVDMLWTRYVLAYDASDQQDFVGFIREKVGSALGILNDAVDALLSLIPLLKSNSDLYQVVRLVVVTALLASFVWLFFVAALRPLWRWLRRRRFVRNEKRIDFFDSTIRLLRRRGKDLSPDQTARELAGTVVDESYGPVVKDIVSIYERVRFGDGGPGAEAAHSAGRARVRKLERLLKEN